MGYLEQSRGMWKYGGDGGDGDDDGGNMIIQSNPEPHRFHLSFLLHAILYAMPMHKLLHVDRFCTTPT